MSSAVGRIGGIIGRYLTPLPLPVIGQGSVFGPFMVLLALTAPAVAILGEDTRGRGPATRSRHCTRARPDARTTR